MSVDSNIGTNLGSRTIFLQSRKVMFRQIEKLLFLLPPEASHNLAIKALKPFGSIPGAVKPIRGTKMEVLGLSFQNRLGLAAGFDKDAQAVEGLARLGFGFIEVGTVTPRPQPGNPKPRLFRYSDHEAVINRMGFNNLGMDAMVDKLDGIRARDRLKDTILGVNIGKNKDTPIERAVDDYLTGIERFNSLADYLTLNISSPNTPGLRSMQTGDQLEPMLDTVKNAQSRQKKYVPLLVKVAPDLNRENAEYMCEKIKEYELDGVIATNTTLDRPPNLVQNEEGGLSGLPLFEKSLEILRLFRSYLHPSCPVVGAGGISDEEKAETFFNNGADLIQVYTGFVYKGTKMVHKICKM